MRSLPVFRALLRGGVAISFARSFSSGSARVACVCSPRGAQKRWQRRATASRFVIHDIALQRSSAVSAALAPRSSAGGAALAGGALRSAAGSVASAVLPASERGALAERSAALEARAAGARRRPLRWLSDPTRVRCVFARRVETRELARSDRDAVSLCAGLQRHLGRRSTSTSRRAPREPRLWNADREAVVNAWYKPRLDLARFEDRPPRARRKRSTWGCQVASLCTPRTPKRSVIRRAPRPTTAHPRSRRQPLHSGVSRSRSA